MAWRSATRSRDGAKYDASCVPNLRRTAALEETLGLPSHPNALRDINCARKELDGLYVARRGAYRVVYALDDAEHMVMVLRIDHRADIYRPR